MSDDSYYLIREYDGKWYATNHSASDTFQSNMEPIGIEELLRHSPPPYGAIGYATQQEAIDRAQTDPYCEYGIVITDEDLERVREEKAADRQAVIDAVAEIEKRYQK